MTNYPNYDWSSKDPQTTSGDESYENFHTQTQISVLTDEVAHGA